MFKSNLKVVMSLAHAARKLNTGSDNLGLPVAEIFYKMMNWGLGSFIPTSSQSWVKRPPDTLWLPRRFRHPFMRRT